MSNVNPEEKIKKGCLVDKTKFHEFKGTQRKMTAKVIKATIANGTAL